MLTINISLLTERYKSGMMSYKHVAPTEQENARVCIEHNLARVRGIRYIASAA
jgi:hypothetical protein